MSGSRVSSTRRGRPRPTCWRRNAGAASQDGAENPVYYRGAVVGYQRRYSAACLLALLKAYRPERFSSRRGHAGTADRGAGAPIVRVFYDQHMKPDDLE